MRKHDYSEGIHDGLIKKAQHRWRCAPRNILTQGSSLCSPTLGYQKRNPYGVRLSHELPLRPLFLLKWLSKAEGDGICQFANILCVPLPFEIAIKNIPPMGGIFFTNPANILCLHLPSPWRGDGGEALMLRLYSKLVFFLWFSLFIRIFHQT